MKERRTSVLHYISISIEACVGKETAAAREGWRNAKLPEEYLGTIVCQVRCRVMQMCVIVCVLFILTRS